jgi:hypothetical protein
LGAGIERERREGGRERDTERDRREREKERSLGASMEAGGLIRRASV